MIKLGNWVGFWEGAVVGVRVGIGEGAVEGVGMRKVRGGNRTWSRQNYFCYLFSYPQSVCYRVSCLCHYSLMYSCQSRPQPVHHPDGKKVMWEKNNARLNSLRASSRLELRIGTLTWQQNNINNNKSVVPFGVRNFVSTLNLVVQSRIKLIQDWQEFWFEF